jgi:hypothetical protein
MQKFAIKDLNNLDTYVPEQNGRARLGQTLSFLSVTEVLPNLSSSCRVRVENEQWPFVSSYFRKTRFLTLSRRG